MGGGRGRHRSDCPSTPHAPTQWTAPAQQNTVSSRLAQRPPMVRCGGAWGVWGGLRPRSSPKKNKARSTRTSWEVCLAVCVWNGCAGPHAHAQDMPVHTHACLRLVPNDGYPRHTAASAPAQPRSALMRLRIASTALRGPCLACHSPFPTALGSPPEHARVARRGPTREGHVHPKEEQVGAEPPDHGTTDCNAGVETGEAGQRTSCSPSENSGRPMSGFAQKGRPRTAMGWSTGGGSLLLVVSRQNGRSSGRR